MFMNNSKARKQQKGKNKIHREILTEVKIVEDVANVLAGTSVCL